MAKANDKKVVRDSAKALVSALGNLLESERERQFRSQNGKSLTRAQFCNQIHLVQANVAHIETGRMLGLGFNVVRPYLSALKRRDIPALRNALQQVRSGLRQLEQFLDEF